MAKFDMDQNDQELSEALVKALQALSKVTTLVDAAVEAAREDAYGSHFDQTVTLWQEWLGQATDKVETVQGELDDLYGGR